MYRPIPTAAPGGVSATVGVGRDDLISGEAVALDLPPANIGLRIASGLIDIIVGYLILAGLQWAAFEVVGFDDIAMLLAVLLLSLITALVVVPTALETVTRGKTFGHLALGLRTVRDDAGPITFRHALTRSLVGFVELYSCSGLPALLAAATTRRTKRFGDLLAGTYVIRDRRKLPEPAPVSMPPALAWWAESADVAPLPDRLALLIRQFLLRRGAMREPSRSLVAQRLLRDCAPYVAPAPPPGLADEEVLTAIIAERGRRDAARLEREGRLRERLLR